MMKKHYVILILLISASVFGQCGTEIKQRIVNRSETIIEKIGNRGLMTNGGSNVYFVANDLKTISAYRNEKKVWQLNVIKALGKPKLGKPAIRHLKIVDSFLIVTYGKHNFVNINLESGLIEESGED